MEIVARVPVATAGRIAQRADVESLD